MNALEQAAWRDFERWGPWAKATSCADCGTYTYCHSKNGKRYICVSCFDQLQQPAASRRVRPRSEASA